MKGAAVDSKSEFESLQALYFSSVSLFKQL